MGDIGEDRRWGWRLLGILVGVFAVVIGVNVYLAVLAGKTNSGIVDEKAYEDGLAYNKTLAVREKERALGWRIVLAGDAEKLGFEMKNADGAPLEGAKVTMDAVHTVANVAGVSGTLVEAPAGHYALAVAWPMKGPWNVTLAVTKGADTLTAVQTVVAR